MRKARFRMPELAGRITTPLFSVGLALALAALFVPGVVLPVQAAPVTYTALLSGPAESPPNNSPGTGFSRVDLDLAAHTLTVHVSFSGLMAPTTASHIHACTAAQMTGTAGVATQVPTFTGFPLGVTSGTYDHSFDTRALATYNPAFVSANGGTAASAEAALAGCISAGRAYLNVHSTALPSGEIRGFLMPAPTDKDQCKDGRYQSMTDPRTGEVFRNQGQCVSYTVRPR